LIPLDEQASLHVSETLRQYGWIAAAALPAAIVLFANFWPAWKRWGERMLFVLVMAFVPFVFAFVISLKSMCLGARWLIAASPFLYLALSAAAWEIVQKSRKDGGQTWKSYAGWCAAGIFALLLLISLQQYYFNPRYGREQWRDVALYIENNGSAGQKDLIVYDPAYFDMCYEYYQKRAFAGLPATPELRQALTASKSEVVRRVGGYRRVWLVRSHHFTDEVLDALRGVLQQRCYRRFPKHNAIEVFGFDVPT
jgi:hypothetical protein